MSRGDRFTYGSSVSARTARHDAVFEALEPRLLLSGSTGPAYDVWGGFEDQLGNAEFYLNIDQQDYDYLGSADDSGVFSGQYDYYVVAARYPVAIDSITLGAESLASFDASNIRDSENLSGASDSSTAIVGQVQYPAGYRGYVAFMNPGIEAETVAWDGLEVNVLPLPAGPLEAFVDRSTMAQTGDDYYVEFEYDVEVGGVGLTRLQVDTPWGVPFDSQSFLPGDWAGEDWTYDGGYFWFQTWTEGPEIFFEFEVVPAEVQWATLDSMATLVTVTYEGGTWADAVDFAAVPMPSETPEIVWPVFLSSAPTDTTIEWTEWLSPSPNSGISVSLYDGATWPYQETFGAWLPPESQTWTPPEQLLPGLAYLAEVEYENLSFHDTGPVSVGVESATGIFTFFLIEGGGAIPADLVITGPALSETTALPGQTVELTYDVENVGDTPAGASWAELYRSDDPFVDASDLWQQSRPVGLLGPHEYSTQTMTFQAPMTAGTYHYAVVADSLAEVVEYNELNNWSTTLELVVTESVIDGHVYDYHTGDPLAGIRINIYEDPNSPFADNNAWEYVDSVVTDAMGLYEVWDLPDGYYRLRIHEGQSSGLYHYIDSDLLNVSVSAGTNVSDNDFQLRHAGSITGHVYDSVGYPLENIEVVVQADYINGDNFYDWHNSWTDSSGRYEIWVLESDLEIYPVKIGWAADDYGTAYGTQIAPGLYSATAAGTVGPDFNLELGGWITGSVETSTGLPITDHWDILEPVTMVANGMFEDPNVRTDGSGNFRIPVPAGTDIYFLTAGWDWGRYDLGGDHFAWGERWIGPYTVEPGQTAVIPTLVVPEAVTVSGTVTDLVGDPVPYARVGAFGHDIYGGEIWLDEGDGTWTDDLGNYTMSYVPAGEFVMAAWADGFLGFVGDSSLNQAPGSSAVYDIVMTPAEQGAVVTGQIANFGQIGPQNASETPLPYEIVEYDELLFGVAELGVMAYDYSQPWTAEDFLFIDTRFTGEANVEDGYDDYLVPNAASGSFSILTPTETQAIFAYASQLSPAGGWWANLSESLEYVSLAPDTILSGQNLTILVGDNSVSGSVFFPAGHSGNVSVVSTTIILCEWPSDESSLGRAVADVAPDGSYVIGNIPDGTYYISAVADGVSLFTSSPFTVASGQAENVDIHFEYPLADLTFSPPETQLIRSEPGSVVPLPVEMINIGEADPGPANFALYISGDSVVDDQDIAVPISPPGVFFADAWGFQVPEVEGTYYLAALADPADAVEESDELNNWSQTITLELTTEPIVEEFAFADYFPLGLNQAREYILVQTDPAGITYSSRVVSVVAAAGVDVNGAATTEVRKFSDGTHSSSSFYSFNEVGLQLHASTHRYSGGWRRTDFGTALTMCPADVSVGSQYGSTAPWQGVWSTGEVWTGTCLQEATVLGFEEIVTPAGTFNALRVRFVTNANKSGGGVDLTISDNYDAWLVEGLGMVAESGVMSETTGESTKVWAFSYQLADQPSGWDSEPQIVDLVAHYDDRFIQGGQVIPGQRVYVPVVVQNLGSDPVNGQVAVEVYASTDQFLSGDDVLMSRQENVRVRLNPGASQLVRMNVYVPDGAQPGQYFVLTCVDADDVVEEIWEDNNVAFSALASQYVYQFGTINGNSVTLTMADELGTDVRFSLRGPGYGEVTRNDDGSLDVAYYETTVSSVAIIRSPRRTNGIVRNVSVVESNSELAPLHGQLRALNARNIDLTGDIIADGWVGTIMLDDIASLDGLDEYDHTIVIGQYQATPAGSVKLVLGSVGELSIFSRHYISSLVVSEWVDNNATRDEIAATGIGKLLVRGDRRRDIVGHFGADLLLGEAVGEGVFLSDIVESASTEPVDWPVLLGNAVIKGDLYDASWNVYGSMGNLMVAGRVENSTVSTTANMGAISFGGALNSDFQAGVRPEVDRLADDPEDFMNADATIRAITVRPALLPGTGEAPFFQNSNVSAGHIGRVSLVNLIADNAGETFGFYAATIASIRHRDSETGESWLWRKEVDGPLSILDFMADAFSTVGPDIPE